MNKFEALLKKGIAEIYTTKAPVVEGFSIVNNSSVSVEMYYEIDKEEYGNTIVNSGSSATISINPQYPYYLRYGSNASGNTQIFNGVYKGSSYNGSVGYYDWNIQPPNAVGSDTEWRFNEGDNGILTITGSSQPSLENKIAIVNNSNDDVEIYYEVDKEEYGNTTIMSGETVTITLEHFSWDTPYFIRYASGGHTNSHVFTGVYQGVTETNLEVGYYDGNILPPHESKTDTRWVFYDGDGGTLTISGSSEPTRVITYDGENQVGYGEYAENPIQYEGGQE